MHSSFYTFQGTAGYMSILANARIDAKIFYEEMCEAAETEHETWSRVVAEGDRVLQKYND